MSPVDMTILNLKSQANNILKVVNVLEQSHEVHIRWSAEWNYDAVTPFSSRVPSGFHVFYTPGENATSYV